MTSPEFGKIEILLNRVIPRSLNSGDDYTTDEFILLVETRLETANSETAHPSLAAHHLVWELQNPPMTLPRNELDAYILLKPIFLFSPEIIWPHGLYVVTLRAIASEECSLPSKNSLLILRRVEIENVDFTKQEFLPSFFLTGRSKPMEMKSSAVFRASEVVKHSLNLQVMPKLKPVSSWIRIEKAGVVVYQVKIDFSVKRDFRSFRRSINHEHL